MVGVEQWAELRRLHLVKGVPINEIVRRTGLARNTVRRAIRSEQPPRYERQSPPRSKLDPFKGELARLLREDPRLPGARLLELIQEQGYEGSRTVLYDHLREERPRYLPPVRTFQRTRYRPGEILQFDLWRPREEIPVGYGQTRRGYVVVACLGYSRAGAGALIFSKHANDILAGLWRCIERLGALPKTLVTDREGSLHAGRGRPTEPFAAFCGQLPASWHICEPRDAPAKGLVERLQGYLETNFEPARVFANHLDFQDQLDRWFEGRANPRTHATLRARPVDRLAEERLAMRPLPTRAPQTDERFVTRVAPDPYVRFDRNDYSLDPRLVGRRVEVRATQHQILAVELDTGQLAARHRRVFAKGQTIQDPAHRRALERMRVDRRAEPTGRDIEVEARPLSRYDALIPA